MHTVPHKQHTSFYNYFAILLKGWSYELYTTICTAPAYPQHVLAPLECMADGDDCILCALAALLCRASVLCHIVACANIVLHVCSRGKKKRGAKAQKPSPPQRGRYHPFLDHDKALLHSFAKSTAVTPNCVSHTPYHGDHLFPPPSPSQPLPPRSIRNRWMRKYSRSARTRLLLAVIMTRLLLKWTHYLLPGAKRMALKTLEVTH